MSHNDNALTFGEHLELLRRMLIKVVCVVTAAMLSVFCFKEPIFNFLLAPCQGDFISYQWLRAMLANVGLNSEIYLSNIHLVATEISTQFMAHLSVSFYLGLLISSPFILFELMRYVSPALYHNERRYAGRILCLVYILFLLGMAVSYWILFPISCRFLSGYSVSTDVNTLITLDSYISLFTSITLLMGVVFQMPVVAIILAKIGLIDSGVMCKYRKHAFLLITIAAAIITPPDILTLIIVSGPLYLLYEISILCVKTICRKRP